MRSVFIIGVFCLSACGGTRSQEQIDPEIESWEVEPPELPIIPELPRLRSWDCPSGWEPVEHATATDEDGEPFHWCRPAPVPRLRSGDYVTPLREDEVEAERPICDPANDGTFPVVGFSDCQPLGDPCPTGTFPEIPLDVPGNRLYVLLGAEEGDGSESTPFGTIAEAIDAASPEDVIVIGPGTYEEQVQVSKDLVLWGACVQRTIISAPGPSAGSITRDAAIRINLRRNAVIRNVRLTGAQEGVVSEGNVTLDGVWIQGATDAGVFVHSGAATLIDVLIDSISMSGVRLETNNFPGVGMFVFPGLSASERSLDATRVTIENTLSMGAYIQDRFTTASMQDVLIRQIHPQPESGELGVGLYGSYGAMMTVDRVMIDAATFSGLQIFDVPNSDFRNIYICDTRPEPAGSRGFGFTFIDSNFAAHQMGLERNRYFSMLGEYRIRPIDYSLTMEDVVIVDTFPDESLSAGVGMRISTEGETEVDIELDRFLVERSRAVGLVFYGQAPIDLTMTDVAILDTSTSEATGLGGYGLQIVEHVSATLTRGLIESSVQLGAILQGETSSMSASDLTVRDTIANESSNGAHAGLYQLEGFTLTLERGRFEGNHAAGLAVVGADTTLQAVDLAVVSTEQSIIEASPSVGFITSLGGHAMVERALFDDNSEVAVVSVGEGSHLDLRDATVRGTRSNALTSQGGLGLSVIDAGSAIVERAHFENNTIFAINARDTDSFELNQVLVTATRSSDYDGRFGRGLHVEGESRVTVTNSQFIGNRDAAIVAYDEGTELILEHVLLADTTERSCFEFDDDNPNNCTAGGHGYGLGVYENALVRVDDVEITGSAEAGVQLFNGGTIEGSELYVHENSIGINQWEPPFGYSIEDVVEELTLWDNDRNFDTSRLNPAEDNPAGE